MTQTIAQKLAAMATEDAEAAERRAMRMQVLRDLPGDLPCPTLSNEKGGRGLVVNCWVSFSRGYGEDWHSADVLAALEKAGFTPLPATLAQYGNYRRGVHPGLQGDLPEEYSHSKLGDSEPIAPLWIVPNQHTEPEAFAFYRSPSGMLLKVKVPALAVVRVSAERVKYPGGWRYERGTGKLHYPDGWHSITDEQGQPIAQVSVHSRAYVDTEQGISGAIYFSPFLDHADFPLTPAQFYRRLEADQ